MKNILNTHAVRQLCHAVACVVMTLVTLSLSAAKTGRAGWVKVTLTSYNGPSVNVSSRDLPELARVADLEDYRGYTTGSVRAEEVEQLRGSAKRLGIRVDVEEFADHLALGSAIIDTRRPLTIPREGRPATQYEDGIAGLYAVAFHGPAKPEWLDEIASLKATLVSSIVRNGELIGATPEIATRVEALPYVQWMEPLHPFLKACPDATAGKLLQIHIADIPGSDKTIDRVRQLIVAGSERPGLYSSHYVVGVFASAAVEQILREPAVIGIYEEGAATLSDERQAIGITSNVQSSGGLLLPSSSAPGSYKQWLHDRCPECANLSGDGFKISIADSGFFQGVQLDPIPENRVHCTPATVSHPNVAKERICFTPTWVPGDTAMYRGAFNWTPHTTTCPSSTNPCDLNYHGTFVAGLAVGDGSLSIRDSGLFFMGTGIAPSAGLVVTKQSNGNSDQVSSSTIMNWSADASAAGAFIQNISANDPTVEPGIYDPRARMYDKAVRGVGVEASNPPRTPVLLTVSAGNVRVDNSYNSVAAITPATAKNVISVGAAESVRPSSDHTRTSIWDEPGGTDLVQRSSSYNNIWRFSGHGTKVQRGSNPWEKHIKPDLMAPAAAVIGAMSPYLNLPAIPVDDTTIGTNSERHQAYNHQGLFGILANNAYNQQYLLNTGTSFAAPVGAGAAVIASRIYSSTPGAASPALIKAMLTATARSMRGGTNYSTGSHSGAAPEVIGLAPDDVQGFGMIDITDITDASISKSYLNQSHEFTSAGQKWERTYVVTDSTKPVKMSLAWSDAADNLPTATGAVSWLANDLDLEVYTGNGSNCTVYRGNNIGLREGSSGEESTVHSCTGGGFDRKNNVEKVLFNPNADGVVTFTVRVKAHTISARAVPCASSCPTVSQDFALYVQNATAVTNANLPTPSNVTATGSATQTAISWTGVGGVNKYRVLRRSGSNAFQLVAEVTDTTVHVDTTAASGMYRYAVQAVADTVTSAMSKSDYAYVGTFTDDPLVPTVTSAKAAHVQELRGYVDDLRLAVDLPAATYQSAATAGLQINGADISQLRAALDAARANSIFGLPGLGYANAITAGVQIRAVDIAEIRNALR